METSNGILDAFVTQVREIKKIYFDELDHVVENSRWLTTLVLAEIGGIAAYRKLMDAKSLSVPFAIIILLLTLTILCFMICVLISRNAKIKISTLVIKNIKDAQAADSDRNITRNQADERVTQISIALDNAISKEPKHTRIWERIGIVLFALSSICATVVLFLSEISALLGF